MARQPVWINTASHDEEIAPAGQTGNFQLALIGGGYTLTRVLTYQRFYGRQWRDDSPEYTRQDLQNVVPIAFGVYWMGDPGASTSLLPWRDRNTYEHWVWWERIYWKWMVPIHDSLGYMMVAPDTDNATRDVRVQRGPAAAGGTGLRYCWEVDLGAANRPPIGMGIAGQVLVLAP